MAALAAVLAVLATSLGFIATSASATPDVQVTICHGTGSRTNPYVVITVDRSSIDEVQNAPWNGHGDQSGPAFSATLPKHTAWGDIIPAYGSFPGINTGSLSWIGNGCNVPGVYDATAQKTLTADICYATTNVTVSVTGSGEASSAESLAVAQAAAHEAARADAQAKFDSEMAKYPGHTDGTCGSVPLAFNSSTPYCAVADATLGTYTRLTLAATGPSQDAADAQLRAQATGLTSGIVPAFGSGANAFVGLNWDATGQAIYAAGCVVATPMVVSATEAATVPEEVEPIAVAIPPEAATVPKAAVAAGGGSSAPGQLPGWALILVALGCLGVAASGTRLLLARSR